MLIHLGQWIGLPAQHLYVCEHATIYALVLVVSVLMNACVVSIYSDSSFHVIDYYTIRLPLQMCGIINLLSMFRFRNALKLHLIYEDTPVNVA